MPETTDASVVDLDVTGDGTPEGMTSAFHEDDNEESRLAYIEDVLDGSSDRVTPWKSSSFFCCRIDVNGAENRLLDSMKRCIHPTLTVCSRLVQKPIETLRPADFASIFLNRDWFILLYDSINSRIEDPGKQSTIEEIFEMQRVWLLQCIYNTTAKNILQDGSEWFQPAHRLHISYDRYSYTFQQLGADLPPISVNAGLRETEEDASAEQVSNKVTESIPSNRIQDHNGRNGLFEMALLYYGVRGVPRMHTLV
jgi:hypothetical protein